jgi:hypothetical protein
MNQVPTLVERWRHHRMRKSVNVIKELLDGCSDQDRDEWKGHAQTVLGAVRASHPTRRGVNSAIAAAFFESSALPELSDLGWNRSATSLRRVPFTLAIERNEQSVRILIAIVQLDAGKPRRKYIPGGEEDLFVVQLQKNLRRALVGSAASLAGTNGNYPQATDITRAYAFNDFDVLAVSMQPVTRSWADFRYALAAQLVPRDDQPTRIAQSQVVPLKSSDSWTDYLPACLNRLCGWTGGEVFEV